MDNVWGALHTAIGYVLPGLLQQNWLPQNWVEIDWFTAAVPPIFCLLGVHLFFRYIYTILWFSVKVVLASMVYVHIRALMSTSTLPYSFESIIFGVPSGTLQSPLTVGLQIMQAKALIAIAVACPRCFPTPIPPPVPPPPPVSPSPWVDWINDHSGM
jgi:hypothetical protein